MFSVLSSDYWRLIKVLEARKTQMYSTSLQKTVKFSLVCFTYCCNHLINVEKRRWKLQDSCVQIHLKQFINYFCSFTTFLCITNRQFINPNPVMCMRVCFTLFAQQQVTKIKSKQRSTPWPSTAVTCQHQSFCPFALPHLHWMLFR